MPKYNIYVRQSLDEQLKIEARRLGVRPKDIIRMRLEAVVKQVTVEPLLVDAQRTRESVFGVLKILEQLAPDIAYVGAVSRISTKQNDSYFQSAQAAERQIASLIAAVKRTLADSESEGDGGL